MSNGRGRGVIFFAIIGVLAIAGGIAVWKVRGRSGGGDAAGEESGGGKRGLAIRGRGTTWQDEDGANEPSGALEGVVLDPDGKPVDGAMVTLGRARGRNEEATTPYAFMQAKGMAVTAGGGRFRIERLVPGEFAATAAREGFAPAQRGGIQVKAKETASVELKLAAGGIALGGRVLDVGGGAVPGAKVTAFGRLAGGGRAPSLFHALADGEGKYRFSLARGNYSLLVEAEGYASANEQVFVARATTKDLRLVPAARLSGRVVEREGKEPVADAEVSLTSAERNDFKPPRDAKADASGQFTFTGLEPGTYEVMARRGALIGAGKVVALAVAQSVDGIEIEVDRGFTVSGKVKDEREGGLPNVRISAYRDTPPFGQAARTRSNPDGTYALEGMLPGNYRLTVQEEGYGYGNARARVLAADVPKVDVTLPAAVKVTGKVVSPEGRPVEGARVQAQIEVRSGGGTMMTGDFATTVADGSFELKRVVPGHLTVTVRHDELGAEKVGPDELKAGESKTLHVTLKKGGSISGVVRTADNRPAPDVQIRAIVRSGMGFSSSDAQDVSGPDGRYRITGLTAGRTTVIADRSGRISLGGPDEPHQKTLPLADGEEKTGIDLVVPESGLSIRGTVVAADGKPVSGAIVLAGPERDGRAFRGGGRSQPKAYSGLDGQFAIEDLAKASYTLWASHPDFPDAEMKGVAGGTKDLRLQLPADTLVSGLVVTPEGKPVSHYTITLLPGGAPGEKPEDKRRRQMNAFDARTQRVTDPGGAFEVRRLAGGNHELVINTAGGESATQTVSVQAGERKTGVRIQVQPGLRITGRVLEHGSNRPIAAATASIFGTGNARAEATAGADGTFTIEGAPAGEMVRLSVRSDETRYVSESKELTVKPGQTTIDAGVIKLLPGNARERMFVDAADRGQIGAFPRIENGRAVLGPPMPDSAAFKAGLKRGDVLVSIDGKETADLGSGALNYLMSGKPDTQVTLVVETPGGAPRSVPLTREAQKPRPPAPAK